MAQNSDLYVIIILSILIVIWAISSFRRWLFAPPKYILPFDFSEAEEPEGEAVDILEEAGYEVWAGKLKIPIHIEKDDEVLGSRLFIDYIAKQHGEWYVVKVSRERMPMEWTGSGIRERLMPYWMIFGPAVKGLLYVDCMNQQVHKVTFHLGGRP
ncbi:hypothetical protein [Marinicrinis lubricantis]|uniref:Uncharacterized protein n=1 Tax=Marinicrinis lubricantis TaxID=2086470 RepID=A0ABW1IRV7_9BACL